MPRRPFRLRSLIGSVQSTLDVFSGAPIDVPGEFSVNDVLGVVSALCSDIAGAINAGKIIGFPL